MHSTTERFSQYIHDVKCAVDKAETTCDIKKIEDLYLNKNGLLINEMKNISKLSPEDRPAFGAEVNKTKAIISDILSVKRDSLARIELDKKLESERVDITLPGIKTDSGNYHILEQTFRQVKRTLNNMGFEYAESPELEEFKYNFSMLNYPPNHPAMDEQDTFYIDNNYLLRTQCTSIQGRIFEERKPPLKIFTLGKTFRNEAVDRTHSHTFHQIDAFLIDKDISLANLKYTLSTFVKNVIGDDVKVRFRPDFFPFVEPGVDYAISSPRFFNGKWLELGGAGLIHPNILRSFGINPDVYSGFAFGLGLERIPMLIHGIDDLRQFLENDMRFLEQFPS